ncbi:hypothetical protein [Burkholderia mayonis]
MSDPSLPMIRWHGTMIEMRFAPFAAATARTASGRLHPLGSRAR